MNAQRVRIVVGEGRSSQHGLLRFVLDGEGYDVVGDAANPAELARVLASNKPDVVVLDDGIGATAVGMVREMVPRAKIVLVWPGAVVPIGGAAQVAPSRVLQELGPAVAKATGMSDATAASTGAALVDEVKSDPALLRTIREAGAAAAAGAIIVDREPAPVVILPVTPSDDDDLVAVPDVQSGSDAAIEEEADGSHRGAAVAGAAGVGVAASLAGQGTAAASTAVVGARSDLNRRLGNFALGSAAVAGAIVLALALGGAKVPIAQVSGEAFTFTPPAAPGPAGGSGSGGPGVSFGGNDNHGGQGNGNHDGGGPSSRQLDFYPIQPYLSSFLPASSLPPVAGGPIPPVNTTERRGGHGQHQRDADQARHERSRARHGNRGS